jgi:hypothetical protein
MLKSTCSSAGEARVQHPPDEFSGEQNPLVAISTSRTFNAEALNMIRPSDRFRMLVEHFEMFGLDPVFTHTDIKLWFPEMTDTAIRVMVNRQCAKGDVVRAVCHGVYQASRLDWSSKQILAATALKLRGGMDTYVTMHSAIEEDDGAELPLLLVCLTAGRDGVITSERHGILALKHTNTPIDDIRGTLAWDENLRCLRASKLRARLDFRKHQLGLRSMLRKARANAELPEL